MGMMEDMEQTHNEIRQDIEKRLAEITKGAKIEENEFAISVAMLHQKEWHGKFEYSFENGKAAMTINMNRVQLIQMCAAIADSVFADKYDFITRILAYEMVEKVISKRTGKAPDPGTIIDCHGKTEAEIELMKEMFKKSPEELEKLRKQLNE